MMSGIRWRGSCWVFVSKIDVVSIHVLVRSTQKKFLYSR